MIGTYRIQAGSTIFNVGGDGKRPSTYPVLNLDGGNPGRKHSKHYQEARAKLAQATGDPTVLAEPLPKEDNYDTPVHRLVRTQIEQSFNEYARITGLPIDPGMEVADKARAIGAFTALDILNRSEADLDKLVAEGVAPSDRDAATEAFYSDARFSLSNVTSAVAGTSNVSFIPVIASTIFEANNAAEKQNEQRGTKTRLAKDIVNNALASTQASALRSALHSRRHTPMDAAEKAALESSLSEATTAAEQAWGKVGDALANAEIGRMPHTGSMFGLATATMEKASARAAMAQFPKASAVIVASKDIISYGVTKAMALSDPELGKELDMPNSLNEWGAAYMEWSTTIMVEYGANKGVSAVAGMGKIPTMAKEYAQGIRTAQRAAQAAGQTAGVGARTAAKVWGKAFARHAGRWSRALLSAKTLGTSLVVEAVLPTILEANTRVKGALFGTMATYINEDGEEVSHKDNAGNPLTYNQYRHKLRAEEDQWRAQEAPNRGVIQRGFDYMFGGRFVDDTVNWWSNDKHRLATEGATDAMNQHTTAQRKKYYDDMLGTLKGVYGMVPAEAHRLAVSHAYQRAIGYTTPESVYQSLAEDPRNASLMQQEGGPEHMRRVAEISAIFGGADIPDDLRSQIEQDSRGVLGVYPPEHRRRYSGLRTYSDQHRESRAEAHQAARSAQIQESRDASKQQLVDIEARREQLARQIAAQKQVDIKPFDAEAYQAEQDAQREASKAQWEKDREHSINSREQGRLAAASGRQSRQKELVSWQDRYRKRINEFDKRRYDGQNVVDDNMAWKPVEPIGQPKVGSYRLGGRYSG